MQTYVKYYAKQSSSAVGMCQFCKQRVANAFVIIDLFHSYIS